MNRVCKLLIPLLIFSILLTSCTFNNNTKSLEQIKSFINKNEFNACLQFVKGLENEDKVAINTEVCNVIINKFIELRDKSKIDETYIFDLSLINTVFAENCQKLWNIISEFDIDKSFEHYNECVNLRYYSEMIDYTRYCDIYSLVKKANDLGYLNELSIALYEYENKGNNANLKLLFNSIRNIDYTSFDPQQYLVSDFRNAHNNIIKAINELDDGFNTDDSTTVATAINSLRHALTDILYITDTLTAVNIMQKTIYKKISTDNIYAPFDSEIKITKRDYTTGMKFSLDSIFGGIKDDTNEDATESTTAPNANTIPLDEVIKIAVDAINNTKAFTGDAKINLIQTRNIKLTAFETDSTISDAENMIKANLTHIIKQSNGTGSKTYTFTNGTDGQQKINNIIPPANKTAVLNADAVSDFTCIKGSGGYIITFKLKPELIKKGNTNSNIGSIVNTFEFDNSESVKNFNTSYSETTISLIVNNSGKLIEFEYTISGISNCEFEEKNGTNEYKAQFTFKNTYKYELKY